jgi:hypothetical protein
MLVSWRLDAFLRLHKLFTEERCAGDGLLFKAFIAAAPFCIPRLHVAANIRNLLRSFKEGGWNLVPSVQRTTFTAQDSPRGLSG